jgi:hypothetical protein
MKRDVHNNDAPIEPQISDDRYTTTDSTPREKLQVEVLLL